MGILDKIEAIDFTCYCDGCKEPMILTFVATKKSEFELISCYTFNNRHDSKNVFFHFDILPRQYYILMLTHAIISQYGVGGRIEWWKKEDIIY